MSSKLCSKGSSGASFVCCSMHASLSASGRGGWCFGSFTLVCSCCTGCSSPLPYVHIVLLLFQALFRYQYHFHRYPLVNRLLRLLLVLSRHPWWLLLRDCCCLHVGCDRRLFIGYITCRGSSMTFVVFPADRSSSLPKDPRLLSDELWLKERNPLTALPVWWRYFLHDFCASSWPSSNTSTKPQTSFRWTSIKAKKSSNSSSYMVTILS